MGYNSILFIPNDQLSSVDRNPDGFAYALSSAINRSCVEPGTTDLEREFNQFTIPYCAHADSVGLIAAGGNYAELILQVHQGWNHDHHTEEGQVRLLQQLADKLGYTVNKKRKKK